MIGRSGWISERGGEVDMAMIEPQDQGVAGRREIGFPNQPPAPRDPAELACDVTTRVGTTIHLRPIRPDDAPRLVDFHQHLSPRSVYRRFFSAHPRLSAAEVERFTCVDYVDRMAFIAEDGDQLVAVGRYDRSPGTAEAEVAFVVADQYQHHGIGTLLLEQLADAGWRSGITTFVAMTLMENRDMLGVFVDSGFRVTTSVEHGIVSVRFLIEPDEAYRVVRTARHARIQSPARHRADTPPC
jgi:GNAT superfamily N-acetyltransferase